MKTASVWSEGNNRFMDYCVVADLPTLVWLAISRTLSFTLRLRAPEMQRPTVIAFDLDPGAPATIVQCCQVGLWVREIFAPVRLEAFPRPPAPRAFRFIFP